MSSHEMPHTIVSADHYGPTIDALTRSPGREPGLRLWWLGQAGFALQFQGTRVLIDPYLSDSLATKYRDKLFPHERLHPSPVEPARLKNVSAVLHTHAHTDHLDPWTVRGLLVANRPTFVAPRARTDIALERGIPVDLLVPVTAGDIVEIAPGVTVEAIPAAHETLETDADGDQLCLGYIITIGGVRIYHSGDCVPYDGLERTLREARVDLALLPINGRDEYRTSNGVAGNFTLSEAVALARGAGIPALIGHHFELFDFNTIDRAEAREALTLEATDIQWTLPSLALAYRISTPRNRQATSSSGLGAEND